MRIRTGKRAAGAQVGAQVGARLGAGLRRISGRRMLAGTIASAAAIAGLAGPAPAQPLSVVYGEAALTREGDIDNRERIFLSVPAEYEGRVYLRVLDPGAGGTHDTLYGAGFDTETRYRLFGGEGAVSAAPSPALAGDGEGPLDAPEEPAAPGTLLAEQSFGDRAGEDDAWVTLTRLDLARGEEIGATTQFRLDVEGLGGNDANAFEVEISASPDRSEPVPGARIFSYEPTLRWPNTEERVEIRVTGHAGERVTVQNFDAANGQLLLAGTFVSVPLVASDQDVWAVSQATMPEGDAAIAFFGGDEQPNDVTIAAFDAEARALAFDLPARLAVPARSPTPVAVARPLANCSSVAFDASATTAPGKFTLDWAFGDGATSSEPVVVHAYDAPGHYTATLTVLGEGGGIGSGARESVEVHVRNAPVAEPGDPIVVAPGEEIAFDGTGSVPSDEPIERYLWTFGDGASAEGAEVSHVFKRPGLYRTKLRVEDDAEHPCNFGVATREVKVNFQPVAEAGEGGSYAVGDVVTFRGGASYDVDGEITAFDWAFGDGGGAETALATHSFTAPGTYTARLTVTDDSGVANQTHSDEVVIFVNAPPVARSTQPTRPIAVGEIAEFDASASEDLDGTILSYTWQFGDGAIGEGPVVDYAYAAPGVYPVTLTVTDDSATGSDTHEITFDVTVSAAPIADIGPDRVVTESVVAFDGGRSSDADGVITLYEWDFGDGATATGERVRHAYSEPGVYEVSLRVTDDSGAPLNVDDDQMILTVNQAPIADAGPDLIGVPGQSLVLDGSGSIDADGQIVRYAWSFDDGRTDEGPRIEASFEETGLHRVILEVEDDTRHAAARDTDEVLIRINTPPVAKAGADILTEPGVEIRPSGIDSFDPDADGRIATYRWDFSHLAEPVFEPAPALVFERPGIYTGQLTVIDDSGTLNGEATDEMTIRVNHAPVAEAGPEIISDELTVTLDASGSTDADGDQLAYVWDLGDGSPPVRGQVVTHAYATGGIYPVTLRVHDGTGLGNAGATDATRVIVNSPPVAVAGGNRTVCSGETIPFDGSDSRDPDGGLLRYVWDFGDGTRQEIVNPTKVYERPGTYAVSLTVRDESGSPRGVHTDRIAVIVRESPIAQAGSDLVACTNETIRFDGSRSTDADGAVNLFSWNFGDGSTAGGAQPTHIYERAGEYTVVLTITGDSQEQCAAVDTDETRVTVLPAPELAIAGPGRVAAGVAATFSARVNGAEPDGARLTWDLGDGTTAQGAQIEHVFAEPGERLIRLTAAFDDTGTPCSDIETALRVTVNAAPIAAPGADMAVAVGEEVLFDASASSDPDGVLTAYAWDFRDGTRATGVQARHRFAEPGTYDVRLAVTDDAGVANSTSEAVVTVTVNAAPVAGLALDGQLCPGRPHDWRVGSDAPTIDWTFGDSGTASGASAQHAFPEPGLFPVTVRMDDGRGLANSVREETIFARVNAPPTAAAGPDRVVCPGEPVIFEAEEASDLDGEIVGYEWVFSDGTVLRGQRIEHVFAATGPASVTLTVTDDSGSACATDRDTAAIRVNAAPIIDAGPDREVPVGAVHDIVGLSPAEATDPDGDGIRLAWDTGDGTTLPGAEVKHRYQEPGEYGVTLTAQDATGLACGMATDTAVIRARARR